MSDNQSLTSPSETSFNYSTIHDRADHSQEVAKEALGFRLPSWQDFNTVSERAYGFGDAMVEAANISTQLEEQLYIMLSIKMVLDMCWDEVDASIPAVHHKTDFSSSRAIRLSSAIKKDTDLWEAKCKVDGCVEVLKRSVDRAIGLHTVASRAAGIAMGPS